MKNKKSLFTFLILPFIFIFCGIDKKEPELLEFANSLEYLKDSTALNKNTVSVSAMDVSHEGNLFLLINNFFKDSSEHAGNIHYFDSAGKYKGLFKDEKGNEIKGNYFRFDKSNLLNVFYLDGLPVVLRLAKYDIRGRLYSDTEVEALSSLITALLGNGISSAQDSNGNFYVIPRFDFNNLIIMKINKQFSKKVATLEKKEIIKAIPDFEEGQEFFLNGIATDSEDRIYLTLDYYHGNSQKDGILILDKDFKFERYISGNWLFNSPSGIILDKEGYIYTASTSHDNLITLDNGGDIIAKTAKDNDGGSKEGRMKNPSYIAVFKDKLYVNDSGNQRINIYKLPDKHILNADKPEAPPKPDPDAWLKGDRLPVVSGITDIVNYVYDTDGNRMGAIVVLTATASDPDNDNLTFDWEISKCAGGCTLSYDTSTAFSMPGFQNYPGMPSQQSYLFDKLQKEFKTVKEEITGNPVALYTDTFGRATVSLMVSDGKGGEVKGSYSFAPSSF